MSQNEGNPSSLLKAQIAVAVIGLLGSLGGSWIASGEKFNRELEFRGADIRELKHALAEAAKKLEDQQEKIDKIDRDIEYAKKAVADIASKAGEFAWEKIKTSWPFGKSVPEAKK